MKKFLVLFALFIVPIVAYLFFASGVNHFGKLPVVGESVAEVSNFESSDQTPVRLQGKITILGFLGTTASSGRSMLFNINQKIYKRFQGFEDFQVVMVLPKNHEKDAEDALSTLGQITDTHQWKFIFGTDQEILELFNSLQTPYSLDARGTTDYVFILDKDKKLRGRQDDSKTFYGYNAASVAEITNHMLDDVKVLLAEYRLELKKYKRK